MLQVEFAIATYCGQSVVLNSLDIFSRPVQDTFEKYLDTDTFLKKYLDTDTLRYSQKKVSRYRYIQDTFQKSI